MVAAVLVQRWPSLRETDMKLLRKIIRVEAGELKRFAVDFFVKGPKEAINVMVSRSLLATVAIIEDEVAMGHLAAHCQAMAKGDLPGMWKEYWLYFDAAIDAGYRCSN